MQNLNWKPFAAFAICVIAAPYLAGNPYYLLLLTFAGIYAIVSVGMCLLIGYAGQISLGHAAFFALGGYTSAILTTKFHFPVWAGFISAISITALTALLIGLPTLRLRGHYLAMATLGFGEIVFHIVQSNIKLTGGASGISSVPPLSFFGFDMTSGDGLYYYYLVWAVVALEIIFAFNLIRSRPGRALRSIHGNEDAANACGINTAAYKLKIFVFSATMAALAGFLYAHKEKFIGVNTSELMFSIILVAMVAVGGMANIWGTLVATVLLALLPEFLRAVKEMDILAYGLIIMLFMIFMPEGIFSGLAMLARKAAGKLTALKNKA